MDSFHFSHKNLNFRAEWNSRSSHPTHSLQTRKLKPWGNKATWWQIWDQNPTHSPFNNTIAAHEFEVFIWHFPPCLLSSDSYCNIIGNQESSSLRGTLLVWHSGTQQLYTGVLSSFDLQVRFTGQRLVKNAESWDSSQIYWPRIQVDVFKLMICQSGHSFSLFSIRL